MSVLPCLFSSHQYVVFQGDAGDEGDIGEPGPPGLTVRQQNNSEKTAGLYNFSSNCLTVSSSVSRERMGIQASLDLQVIS